MKTRDKRLLAIVAAAMIVVGSLLWIALAAYRPPNPLPPHRPGFTTENIKKLNTDMRQEHISKLFGADPIGPDRMGVSWSLEGRRVIVAFEDGYAVRYYSLNDTGFEPIELEPTSHTKPRRWIRRNIPFTDVVVE